MLTQPISRRREPEWMDRPDLDAQLHGEALQGLARINRWSFSTGALWRPIRRLAGERPGQSLRVLDLACGAGDVAVGLWHRARRANLGVQITGCDRSPLAVGHARRRAERAGAPVEFITLDVLEQELPRGFDVLATSLFLHHLSEDDAVGLLRRMGEATQHMMLVNDLVRHRRGLALAYVGTRLLSRAPVVHVDGPLSVRAAFSLEEARALAQQAGLNGASIARTWPYRFLLAWRRP